MQYKLPIGWIHSEKRPVTEEHLQIFCEVQLFSELNKNKLSATLQRLGAKLETYERNKSVFQQGKCVWEIAGIPSLTSQNTTGNRVTMYPYARVRNRLMNVRSFFTIHPHCS